MQAMFDLLESEPEPSVRALVGHWLSGCVHPFMDGNGRIVRYFMNPMLASGGYPWTAIRVEDRKTHLVALEDAIVRQDIGQVQTSLAFGGGVLTRPMLFCFA